MKNVACRESRVERHEGNGRKTVSLPFALLFASILTGCGPVGPTDDGPFQRAVAKAAVAFAEAEIEHDQPARPPSTCDDCAGTGTVPSGDGLARVPCRCGAACQCEPESGTADMRSAPRRKRVLYFSAKWCVPCRANEPTFAALAARGWKIGPGADNHIQTIDVDSRPDLRAAWSVTAVPTWLLIDDGSERRRRTGPLDPFEVGRFFEER